MRPLAPALLIALFSCADASVEDVPGVAITRQGVLIFPDAGPRATGAGLGAHLGTAIAACPGSGWVAAAPGDDSIWVSEQGARMRPARLAALVDPLPVACLGESASRHMLMGGPNNTFVLFPDGGSHSVYTQRADAFALSKSYLAVGNTNLGFFTIFPRTTTRTMFANATFDSSPPVLYGIGNSLSWSSRGDLLVANFMARSVGIFPADTTVDGGRVLASQVPLANPDAVSTNTEFGKVVLVGDVTPDVGEEYIVSSPAHGRVYVYSGTALVHTLSSGPSFGASLALEPASYGGLHALWIGEPAADLVHRYLGGTLTTYLAPPEGNNSSFGAAIAVDERGTVAIGAPDYDNGLLFGAGAVFEAVFDGGSTNGQMTQCVAARPCALPDCTTGTCLGGTFCQ